MKVRSDRNLNVSDATTAKCQNVVIFDLDHTISKKDTYLLFLLFLLKRYPWRLLRCILLPWYVLLYKAKLCDNSILKEKFLTAIAAGMERNCIEYVSTEFIQKLLHTGIYASARERIRFHKKQNDCLIVATASFDFYVNLLAQDLGFDTVVCTKAEWDSVGRLTGRIAGRNCYGLQKKVEIENVLSSMNNVAQITVYSDHHADLPLFSIADHAVAINPSQKLKRFSVSNKMTIERWQ